MKTQMLCLAFLLTGSAHTARSEQNIYQIERGLDALLPSSETFVGREGAAVTTNSDTFTGCEGSSVLTNTDGSYENGDAWGFAGIAAPYYGAFAERVDLGAALLCGAVFDLTRAANMSGGTMDVYIWDDLDGTPGSVLSITPGVSPGTVAIWPGVSRHTVDTPDVALTGPVWLGFWGAWPGGAPHWFVAADLNGPGGNPHTNIAPGIGFPTGWQDVAVAFGPTASIGIGALLVDAIDWDRQLGPQDLEKEYLDGSTVNVTAHPGLLNLTNHPVDLSSIVSVSVNGGVIDTTSFTLLMGPSGGNGTTCSASGDCPSVQGCGIGYCWAIQDQVGGPFHCACGEDPIEEHHLDFHLANLNPGDVVSVSIAPRLLSDPEFATNNNDVSFTFGTSDVGPITPIRKLALSVSPNPVVAEATMGLVLTLSGPTSVGIYDVRGRLLRSVVEESMMAGSHSLRIDLRDEEGTPLPSGVYLIRVRQGHAEQHERLTVLR